MSVFLSGLDDWLPVTGFDFEQGAGGRDWTIQYRTPDPIHILDDSDEDCRLYFGFGLSVNCRTHPYTFVGLTQAANVTVEPGSPRRLEWFMGELIMMQRFVALATCANVLPRKVSLYVPDDPDPSRDREATLSYQPIGEITDGKIVPHSMLFTFPEERERLPHLVQHWRASTRGKQSAHNLFFGTLYNDRGFLDSRFLSLTHACESYHRDTFPSVPSTEQGRRAADILAACPADHQEWLAGMLARSGGPSLKQHLEQLLEHAGSGCSCFVGDKAQFLRAVRDARNRLVHQGSAPDHDSYALLQLRESLLWLLRCCFLRDMGFTQDEVETLVRRWHSHAWRTPRRSES